MGEKAGEEGVIAMDAGDLRKSADEVLDRMHRGGFANLTEEKFCNQLINAIEEEAHSLAQRGHTTCQKSLSFHSEARSEYIRLVSDAVRRHFEERDFKVQSTIRGDVLNVQIDW